jgi:hypothetical protein
MPIQRSSRVAVLSRSASSGAICDTAAKKWLAMSRRTAR